MNDAATGFPTAVMDAGLITAARTAAVSGYCIRHWAPRDWSRVALIGCGEQGRFHAEVIAALRPEAVIAAYDPDAARYESLVGNVSPAARPEDAVAGADVVITAGPIVDDPAPAIGLDHIKDDYLVLPLDFDCYVAGDIVAAADLFLVDDREQFEYYRKAGRFEHWPAPEHTDGEAGSRRRDGPAGRLGEPGRRLAGRGLRVPRAGPCRSDRRGARACAVEARRGRGKGPPQTPSSRQVNNKHANPGHRLACLAGLWSE